MPRVTLQKKIIGIIIIERTAFETFSIQAISCEVHFRKKGVASVMLQYVINKYQPKTIFAETDDDSVGFYKKCGFTTKILRNKYPETVRYLCTLTLL